MLSLESSAQPISSPGSAPVKDSYGTLLAFGITEVGLKAKGKAFYEPLNLHSLGVNVFEMISKEKRNVVGCC